MDRRIVYSPYGIILIVRRHGNDVYHLNITGRSSLSHISTIWRAHCPSLLPTRDHLAAGYLEATYLNEAN